MSIKGIDLDAARPFMDRYLDGSSFCDDREDLANAFATHREQAVKPLVEALEQVMTCMADADDVFPDKASRDDAIMSIVADALAKARGEAK